MRRIDTSERPMPEINTAKVCFIIEKARELLSEDVGTEPDASNPTDDGERIVLTDANNAFRRELVEFVRDLDVDESAALVALAWIGRGDFEADDWQNAVAAANERREGPTWKYLLGMALLPDYLQDALDGVRPVLRGLRARRRRRVGPRRGRRDAPCIRHGKPPISRRKKRYVRRMSTEPSPASIHRSFARQLRSWFFTGLVVFGPVAVTAYVAWFVINTIDNWVKPLLPQSLSPDDYLPFHVPGLGVVIAVVGLTLLGFLTANIIGRTLVRVQRGDARPHAARARASTRA